MCGDKDFLSHIYGHKQYEHSYIEKVYRKKFIKSHGNNRSSNNCNAQEELLIFELLM